MIRTHAHVGICFTSGEMRTPEIEPFKRTPHVERSSRSTCAFAPSPGRLCARPPSSAPSSRPGWNCRPSRSFPAAPRGSGRVGDPRGSFLRHPLVLQGLVLLLVLDARVACSGITLSSLGWPFFLTWRLGQNMGAMRGPGRFLACARRQSPELGDDLGLVEPEEASLVGTDLMHVDAVEARVGKLTRLPRDACRGLARSDLFRDIALVECGRRGLEMSG